MNYSFMSFSTPELNLDQIIDTAKLYGYSGFEPRISAGHKHGIDIDSPKAILREAKTKFEESGIKICCVATSCSFANPDNNQSNIELAKRAIEVAAEVGAPTIRVFGGAIPAGINRTGSAYFIVKALTELADFAMQRKVTICIETHDSWCDPNDIADIMRSVNHEAVAVNWDIMHPILSKSFKMEEAFEILKKWIKHVHVHDGILDENKLVFKQIGEGIVDHETAITLLKNSGYNGFLSGEWIAWEPYNIHLPREISIMKSFE